MPVGTHPPTATPQQPQYHPQPMLWEAEAFIANLPPIDIPERKGTLSADVIKESPATRYQPAPTTQQQQPHHIDQPQHHQQDMPQHTTHSSDDANNTQNLPPQQPNKDTHGDDDTSPSIDTRGEHHSAQPVTPAAHAEHPT